MVTRMMMERSGTYVDLIDTHPDMIFLDDIAWNLSMLVRYNGGIRFALSVAEHSLVCLDVAESQGIEDAHTQLAVLMHDAHEYLIGDVVGPVKSLPELREPLQSLADRYDRVIERRFGIDLRHPCIAKIDKGVASQEMVTFSRVGEPEFLRRHLAVPCEFYLYSQQEAYEAFKKRASALVEQVGRVPA